MGAHPYRTHSRSPATVRDAERLVQIQVRHVGPELAWLRETHKRIEVRPVDVHLTAGVMDHSADIADFGFEDAVCRGVRDHQGGQTISVLSDLVCEIAHVKTAILAGLDDNDLHTRHDSTRRVGAVGRRRNEADGPLVVATCVVIGPDGQQPGELSLAPGVRLQ